MHNGNYGKCPKKTLCHTVLAISVVLKITSRKAKSVDPDQTAPEGAV